jgi:hypothetical protein
MNIFQKWQHSGNFKIIQEKEKRVTRI